MRERAKRDVNAFHIRVDNPLLDRKAGPLAVHKCRYRDGGGEITGASDDDI